MEQDAKVAGGHQSDVALIELSVVVIADNIDPSMINPDFLRYNGIVDQGLQAKQPHISTPVFSQVIFESGFTVTAQADRFVFVQRGEALTEDAVSSPDIARRFLEKIPYPAYKAIGINPTGVRLLDPGSVRGVADALIKKGEWMAFGNVSPVVSLKAVYFYENRQITMDVHDAKRQDANGSELPGLLFAVNIHRDISETDQEQRIAKLMSTLSAWKDDLSDFKTLITKFNLGSYAS